MSKGIPRFLERLLLVTGTVLLAVYSLAHVDAWVSSRLALRAFDQALASGPTLQADEHVDFSLWSDKRIREYKASLVVERRLPWAALAIDKLSLRVPVFDGTDDLVLNRGVGWIVGTAKPGDAGNIGLAGHRDGFFRGLKDIASGDAITLTTPQEQATYLVDEIQIVTPDRVDVLQSRSSPSLTLVTCYPFYFVGNAPQRFIVHATLARTETTRFADSSRR
jgi:sortase A